MFTRPLSLFYPPPSPPPPPVPHSPMPTLVSRVTGLLPAVVDPGVVMMCCFASIVTAVLRVPLGAVWLTLFLADGFGSVAGLNEYVCPRARARVVACDMWHAVFWWLTNASQWAVAVDGRGVCCGACVLQASLRFAWSHITCMSEHEPSNHSSFPCS